MSSSRVFTYQVNVLLFFSFCFRILSKQVVFHTVIYITNTPTSESIIDSEVGVLVYIVYSICRE